MLHHQIEGDEQATDLHELWKRQGFDVVESELGEYIVQLRHEAPYHFVFPRNASCARNISDLFQRELGHRPDRAEELTTIARRVLRDKYIKADIALVRISRSPRPALTQSRKMKQRPVHLRAAEGSHRLGSKHAGASKTLRCFCRCSRRWRGESLTCYNSFYGAAPTW